MVSRLLAAFALLFVTVETAAQTYQPFFEDNGTWRVRVSYNAGMGGAMNAEDFQIMLNGQDTILGSSTYKQLWIRGVTISYQTGSAPSPFGLQASDRFYGGFRQENKRVYIRRFQPPNTLLDEQLIFDFNLQIDDTIPWFYSLVSTIPFVVEDTTPYVIGNDTLVAYGCSPFFLYDKVVSSIGSLKAGLFAIIPYWPSTVELLCFERYGNVIYPAGGSCPLIADAMVGVPNAGYELTKMGLYPNPANDRIFLNGHSSSGSIATATIINTLGQEIITRELRSGELDVSDLEPGFYFVRLSNVCHHSFHFVKL